MEETISLKEIFEVLKKRMLLIISFIVGAALVSAVITFFFITPQYESSSQFLVNQSEQESEISYNDLNVQTNVQLINTYNDIITSPVILEDVVSELNLDLSTSQLSEKITVEAGENSQVVTLSATDPDPNLARDIANTTVTTFQAKIPDIYNVDNVSILSEAELKPEPSPVSPSPLLNIAIAIVLGGMVGVGLAFLLEYLDNTIKTESDIEHKLGVPVLGVISHIDDSDIRSDDIQPAANRVKRGGYSGTQTQKKSI